jgi:hypothetical protein
LAIDLRLESGYSSFSGGLESGAVMRWGFGSRSNGIGGVFLMLAMAALVEPAGAQAQQADGLGLWGTSNGLYPLWARPYLFSGFNGSNLTAGSNQTGYTAKLGSGTVGMFVESYGQGNGGWASGTSGNYFGPLVGPPTSLQQSWFAAGDPAWRTSIVGSYKSDLNSTLFNGLYTTASFGVTSIKTNPLGLAGPMNFTGNDAVGVTASAGVGVKLTPDITLEGSVSWTQMQSSGFR